MANINSMAMSADLAKDSRVNIQKSFFGLSKTWVYASTGSKLRAVKYEYSPEDGKAVEDALTAAPDKCADALAGLNVSHASMGNFLLEAACSADGQFVALRLYQYQQLRFQPVSPLCLLEGAEAAKVSSRF